jgi:HPt (histidine-containing phosphotransfer) domain-containing protein
VDFSLTSIANAHVVPQGTRPLPSAKELKDSLSFSYFDKLYAANLEQYQEMLQLYAHEYSIYLQDIDTALRLGDETAFRRIKHKIIYSLHLLELTPMHNNMEVLADEIAHLDGYGRNKARMAYSVAFELILRAIEVQRVRISLKNIA